ncbi:MAG: GTP-binding protein [Deltaproteobacteria bacterium]|jgi:G3E family GTPase|nr:GTP-binding protein [Deltaproteobacteria bacterium]
MTEIICVTGFLGAGKTTFLNKILPICLNGRKTAVIENDFGDAGIDAAVVGETGAVVRELSSGCICCSLKGEMKAVLLALIASESPDVIFVEPSGVSRSTDLIGALSQMKDGDSALSVNVVNLVDVANFEDYLEAFGDFYGDQIASAQTIFFSHRQGLTQEKMNELANQISEMNPVAACYLSDWLEMSGEALWELIQDPKDFVNTPAFSGSGEAKSGAGVFSSWSGASDSRFSREDLEAILASLVDGQMGQVLRAKGFCRGEGNLGWHFNYRRGSVEIKSVDAVAEGRMLAIGQNLNTAKLAELFRSRPV